MKSIPRSEPATVDPNCAAPGLDPDWCDRCKHGFVRLDSGLCSDICPPEGYFLIPAANGGQSQCGRCYYACKTCSGPNDYECKSCFGDAELDADSETDREYCYNKSLIYKVFSSSRWYYVLSAGFLINFIIVVILVVYIMRWRRGVRTRVQSSMMEKSKYNAPDAAAAVTLPYRDYDSSSEEAEGLFSKPYRDHDDDDVEK